MADEESAQPRISDKDLKPADAEEAKEEDKDKKESENKDGESKDKKESEGKEQEVKKVESKDRKASMEERASIKSKEGDSQYFDAELYEEEEKSGSGKIRLSVRESDLKRTSRRSRGPSRKTGELCLATYVVYACARLLYNLRRPFAL